MTLPRLPAADFEPLKGALGTSFESDEGWLVIPAEAGIQWLDFL